MIAAIIVVAALAFYGGMKLGASRNLQANSFQGGLQNFRNLSPDQRQQMQQQFGNGTDRRGGLSGGSASGEIISVDEKSITVKLPSGGSRIIFFSSLTKISKSVDAPVSDLIAGANVMANGTANPDGSITAGNIQIRPLSSAPQQTQQPAAQANLQSAQQPAL